MSQLPAGVTDLGDGTVEIELSNGPVTIIDSEDLGLVTKYKWHARFYGTTYYVARTTSRRSNGSRRVLNIYLHRFLLNAPPDMQVDHLDGRPWNNSEGNLELVTPDENQARRLQRQRGLA